MTRVNVTLLLILSFTIVSHAEDNWRARAGYYQQDAATYQGDTTSLGVGYAEGRRYNLGLNADLMSRRYNGGTTLGDNQFGLTGARAFGEHVYVDATVTTSSTANIFARWGAVVVPHYVVNKNDFGLGLRFADYKTGQAGGINPNYLRYFANGLTLGAGVYVIRTDSYISSYTAQALYAPTERHLVRVVGSAGRVLEDRGLEAQFNSLNVEYTYYTAGRFNVGLSLTDYWSEVRRERVLGLKLGWR